MVISSNIDDILLKIKDYEEIKFWKLLISSNNKDALLSLIYFYEGKYLSIIKDMIGLELDKETISKIIEINDNKDLILQLEKYLNSKAYYYESKIYSYKRSFVLNKLNELIKNNGTIIEYQKYLKKYYKFQSELNTLKDKRDSLLESLREYNTDAFFTSELLFRKVIKKVNTQITSINNGIQSILKSIKEIENELEAFISTINNQFMKRMLLLNKDIIFTLGKTQDDGNPFTDEKLDVTFRNVLDYKIEGEVNYFIACNIHRINLENLKDATSKIEKDYNKVNKKAVLADAKEHYYRKNLSLSSINLINNDIELINMILLLRKIKSIDGVSGIDYIYFLNTLDLIKEDLLEQNSISNFIHVKK